MLAAAGLITGQQDAVLVGAAPVIAAGAWGVVSHALRDRLLRRVVNSKGST